MLTLLVILNVVIAIGYFLTATFVAPTFRLPLSQGLLYGLRASAILFFVGCGLHHVEHAAHIATDPRVAEAFDSWHMVFIEATQAIAAPTFVLLAIYSLRFLAVRIEERGDKTAFVAERNGNGH